MAQGGPASFELIDSDASTYTYEGQSGSLAMPYIIKVSRNDSATGGDYSRRLQTVAAGLSNLYGSYRSPGSSRDAGVPARPEQPSQHLRALLRGFHDG